MNIDEMEAGRELDALVAERVMGWKRLTEGEVYPQAFDEVYPDARGGAGFDRSRVSDWWYDAQQRNEKGEATAICPAEDLEDYDIPPLPPRFAPSTDIAAAWEVVENIERLGYHFSVVCEGHKDIADVRVWHAYFWERENGHGTGDTAPLAICRAALKAHFRRLEQNPVDKTLRKAHTTN